MSETSHPSTTQIPASGPKTLCIDVGGTGLKAMVLDAVGQPLTERLRVETPHPATPESVLAALRTLIAAHRETSTYDRVSVGFPGVVVDNVVHTAPNLDPAWRNFALGVVLEKITSRPVRVLNDAGVQGFGVVTGHGVEMVLTLGTGMGCALFTEGRYVPNLELAHHPFRKGKTYEEYVGLAALSKVGKKRWSKRVSRVIDVVLPIFNPQRLYLGGGNAHHLKLELPERVTICENAAGLLGGIALWRV